MDAWPNNDPNNTGKICYIQKSCCFVSYIRLVEINYGPETA